MRRFPWTYAVQQNFPPNRETVEYEVVFVTQMVQGGVMTPCETIATCRDFDDAQIIANLLTTYRTTLESRGGEFI